MAHEIGDVHTERPVGLGNVKVRSSRLSIDTSRAMRGGAAEVVRPRRSSSDQDDIGIDLSHGPEHRETFDVPRRERVIAKPSRSAGYQEV